MARMITVQVVPQSRKTGCSLGTHGRIKIQLTSPPEKGKANRELIAFLAHTLSIPQRSISLISGATHRTKRLLLDIDLSDEELYQKLGIEVQHALI